MTVRVAATGSGWRLMRVAPESRALAVISVRIVSSSDPVYASRRSSRRCWRSTLVSPTGHYLSGAKGPGCRVPRCRGAWVLSAVSWKLEAVARIISALLLKGVTDVHERDQQSVGSRRPDDGIPRTRVGATTGAAHAAGGNGADRLLRRHLDVQRQDDGEPDGTGRHDDDERRDSQGSEWTLPDGRHQGFSTQSASVRGQISGYLRRRDEAVRDDVGR